MIRPERMERYFDTSPVREVERPLGECPFCDKWRGKFHPAHDASELCESGKHAHCTCDLCF